MKQVRKQDNGRRANHVGPPAWKGMPLSLLAGLGVRQTPAGVVVPYRTEAGELHREKLFSPTGVRYLGPSKPQIPYGLETLRAEPVAIVLTEGESDALALRLAYPRVAVLGVPGASAWRPEWKRYTERFGSVYLSFDGDDAGQQLGEAVLRDIPRANLLMLPRGADTRDILQRLGKGAYAALVRDARARAFFDQARRAAWEVERLWARSHA